MPKRCYTKNLTVTWYYIYMYIYIYIPLMFGVWCPVILSVFTCVTSVHLSKTVKSIFCVGTPIVWLLLFPAIWRQSESYATKRTRDFLNSFRRSVCKSSLSRKSTTDLTENENQECMKGVEFSKTTRKTILYHKINYFFFTSSVSLMWLIVLIIALTLLFIMMYQHPCCPR